MDPVCTAPIPRSAGCGAGEVRHLGRVPLPVGRPRSVKRVRGAALAVQGDQGERGVLVSVDRQCEVEPIRYEVTAQPWPKALTRKSPRKCRWYSQAHQTDSDVGRSAARHRHELASPGTDFARAGGSCRLAAPEDAGARSTRHSPTTSAMAIPPVPRAHRTTVPMAAWADLSPMLIVEASLCRQGTRLGLEALREARGKPLGPAPRRGDLCCWTCWLATVVVVVATVVVVVAAVVVVVAAVVVVVAAVVVVVGTVVVVVANSDDTVVEVVDVGKPPWPWPFTWQGTILQPQRQVQPQPRPWWLWTRTL